MRVISQYIVDANHAGPKAKVDIERILKEKYNARIFTYKLGHKSGLLQKINKLLFMLIAMNTKDYVVIQLPLTNKTGILKLAKNKIGIIHDTDGIRYKDEKMLREEVEALNGYKALIVHNDKMAEILEKSGVKTKMFSLEIFDYLLKNEIQMQVLPNDKKVVIYPGNLEPRKAEFLYSLEEDKMNFTINAYGPDFEENNNHKIIYKGSFSPDQLPYNLEGNLGLVWSGKLDSSDEDVGEKMYNKYNTAHKLSSFLVAGIPVIVWDKSAMADVVDKYNIGYKISNLYEINNIDLKDYNAKKNNTEKLSEILRNGYFTNKAFDEIMNYLNVK